ncbi:hypothetical protein RKD34_004494 [Streptomyces sp. SAI-218]
MTFGTGCSRKASPISAMSGDDDVEQTGRQPRVLEDLRDQGAADDRRVLVRLEDHGVAEGERGGDRLDGQQEGEVEGADHAHDTDRHAIDAVLLAVHRRGDDPALGAQRQVDRLAQELLGEVQLEGGLEAGAAELRDDRLGDLPLTLLDQPERLLEHRATGVGVGPGPLLLRTGGGPVGVVDLFDRGYGDRRQLLVVVRVEVDDVPGTGTRAPLTVDVLLGQVGEVRRHVIPKSLADTRSTSRSDHTSSYLRGTPVGHAEQSYGENPRRVGGDLAADPGSRPGPGCPAGAPSSPSRTASRPRACPGRARW